MKIAARYLKITTNIDRMDDLDDAAPYALDVFMAVLRIAKEDGHGGRVKASFTTPRSIRKRMRWTTEEEEAIRVAFDSLVAIGWLDQDADHTIVPRWADYQDDPTNAGRQGGSRDRKLARQEFTAAETRIEPSRSNGESVDRPLLPVTDRYVTVRNGSTPSPSPSKNDLAERDAGSSTPLPPIPLPIDLAAARLLGILGSLGLWEPEASPADLRAAASLVTARDRGGPDTTVEFMAWIARDCVTALVGCSPKARLSYVGKVAGNAMAWQRWKDAKRVDAEAAGNPSGATSNVPRPAWKPKCADCGPEERLACPRHGGDVECRPCRFAKGACEAHAAGALARLRGVTGLIGAAPLAPQSDQDTERRRMELRAALAGKVRAET